MIRRGTVDDIPDILPLARRFFDASAYPDFTEYSEDQVIRTMLELIEGESGILLVLEDRGIKGIMGALIFPLFMSGKLSGQELFWWCEEKGKGRLLLDEMERTAKTLGAETFMMMSLDTLAPDRLDKLYTDRGYSRSEHTYIRRL